MRGNFALRQSEDANEGLQVEVVEKHGSPGVWMVEAVNVAGEGEIHQAIFAGPHSRERATEYAAMKYGIQ